MFRRLSADKDTFITNKVVAGLRVTDANTGQAGTLALFKLYDESSLVGVDLVEENSRILVHFDLEPLRELTGSLLDLSSPSFKATLKLRDVVSGNPVPSNFYVAVFPLSKSFEEGIGRDVRQFRDIDTCNYLNASTNVTWVQPGASASGTLGDEVDIIEQADLGSGLESVVASQFFATGEEDLSVDVTKIVSATLAGILPDCGLRVSFSGSYDTDNKTRFVKKFTSRHANETSARPAIEVTFDDSLQDDHGLFYFGVSGSLFMHNFHLGKPANIVHGGTPLTGADCVAVRLVSGSYEKVVTGSQYSVGGNFVTGIYHVNFALAGDETSLLQQEVQLAKSASFSEYWQTLDGRGLFTGSLVVRETQRTAPNLVPSRMYVNVRNNRGSYQSAEKVRFHVYAQSSDDAVKASKVPLHRPSLLFKNMYYQIRDAHSGKIIIPFHETGTKMSVNSNGMYFDMYMRDLYPGRVYGIEVKFYDLGVEQVFDFDTTGAVFRVEV